MKKKVMILMAVVLILIMGSTAGATPVKVGKLPYIRQQYFSVEVGHASLKLTVARYSGKIKWHSMNPKIAKVNKNGVVTGKKKGKTYIVAKCGKVECIATCYVAIRTECKKK